MSIEGERGDGTAGGTGTAGGDGPSSDVPSGPTPSFRVSEDVAATIVGLALLVLILLGAIPKGLLP
jgi:hypothetical protein